MFVHEENHILAETMNQLQIHILTCGYAAMNHADNWCGSIATPSFSRLYYILQGEFFIIDTDGIRKLLTAGNCYLLPSGYSFPYGCREFMEQAYFHIKLCDFDEIDILKSCKEPLEFHFPKAQAKNYARLVASKDILASLQARQLLYDSVFSLLNKYQISLERTAYSPQVRSAIAYIKDHLSMQLSIEEIANHTFTAVSTLTRNFRRETGMTISQYIDEAVLFQAEQTLISSKLSVLEISEKFGFCDQFYFARKFKEKYQLPPREYRKLTIL